MNAKMVVTRRSTDRRRGDLSIDPKRAGEEKGAGLSSSLAGECLGEGRTREI
jgi:hypothetical protein